MFGTRPKELPQEIAFLLVPNFSMIAFVSAIEPLRLANRASGRQLYRWRVFSHTGKPVASSNGLEIAPEGGLEGAAQFSTVVVCSGIDAHKFQDRPTLTTLRRLDRKGADIGALCTASHILAQAELIGTYQKRK